jgi:Gpi18-like mannosyltransferase
MNPWTTYDSDLYLRIAAHGYDYLTVGFFPLYPWLLQLFSKNQLDMALTGIIISHVAFLLALVLVFRLTEIEWGKKVAYGTVGILAFSPAAPFWGAVYTESLFLALLAATFLAVRTNRWWLAGFLGGLAALCRNPGFLIAGALFLESNQNRDQNSSIGKSVAWILPLAAFGAVQARHWWYFKSPLAGLPPSEFHRHLEWPWYPVIGDIQMLISGSYGIGFLLVTISGLLFTFTGLLIPLLGWKSFRPGYLLIVTGITMMNLTYASQVLPQTLSATRYMAPLFPVAQALALLLTRIQSFTVRTLIACTTTFVFILFCFMFGKKYYLG